MPNRKKPGPKRKRGPKPKLVPRAMTARQLAFCREYLKDYIGGKAAIRAGYSRKGADQQASVLLRNPKVMKELGRLSAQVTKKAELTAVDVLASVTAVALGDMRELFDPGAHGRARLKDVLALTHQAQALLAGYSEKDGRIELKLENRTRSKEMLMKHLGLLKEVVRLESASELSVEEEEIISKMTAAELKEFREANETVERMLTPKSEAL